MVADDDGLISVFVENDALEPRISKGSRIYFDDVHPSCHGDLALCLRPDGHLVVIEVNETTDLAKFCSALKAVKIKLA